MKELLDQYAIYTGWAHKRLLDVINTLSAEQQHQEVISSFSSLYKTVYHVWGAETVWLRRFSKEIAVAPEDRFNGSMAELSDGLMEVDQQLLRCVLSKTEEELMGTLAYSNLRGQPFNQPLNILLMHVFNHSTYHNGQLVTMLRQLHADNIPETDFVAWSRL